MRSHPLSKAYLALVAVCFFWGTTYLGIRMALESFPPLVLVTGRFLASGSLLLGGAALLGARMPKGKDLWFSALMGLLVLGVGNGALTYSELWIPSGMAALIITLGPFWFVGLDALMPGGERLHAPTIAAMLVGCVGAALLVAPDLRAATLNGPMVRGFLLLQVGCFGWAYGSLLQRRHPSAVNPIILGGVQQLAAGLAYLPLALLFTHEPIRWSARGVGAILYLIVFGSIVGYSSYIYAMAKLPVAVASIYSYVNPVVAVGLGWLIYREPFGAREAAAMATIFAGVALVKRFSRRLERRDPAATDETPQPLRPPRQTGRDRDADAAPTRSA